MLGTMWTESGMPVGFVGMLIIDAIHGDYHDLHVDDVPLSPVLTVASALLIAACRLVRLKMENGLGGSTTRSVNRRRELNKPVLEKFSSADREGVCRSARLTGSNTAQQRYYDLKYGAGKPDRESIQLTSLSAR